MKKTLIITSPEVQERAYRIVKNLPLDVVHDVIIREHKKNRSLDQNALYWKWVTIIADELGYTKDEYHEIAKEKHLVPILIENDESFWEMWNSLREVYKNGLQNQALALKKKTVSLCTTTTLNVKLMADYMGQIEKEAIGLGINLPHPEDER